ncbi:hypothetical protein ASF00_04330 [Sphingomonas sp. Leaf34]|nr:hypothetical protein ASF00_04330 [Sphingomonas sp. Leaf34]
MALAGMGSGMAGTTLPVFARLPDDSVFLLSYFTDKDGGRDGLKNGSVDRRPFDQVEVGAVGPEEHNPGPRSLDQYERAVACGWIIYP